MKSSGTHENVNSGSLWVTGEFLLISLFFSAVSLHYSCAYILILKSGFFPPLKRYFKSWGNRNFANVCKVLLSLSRMGEGIKSKAGV